jgi:predicted ATP-dependent endonuclease of OLD family
MKIKSVTLKGFRGYRSRITIHFEDLCAIVGKNDIGKSTVLEALDIFFNDGKGCVKIDRDDINKGAAAEGDTEIEIAVEFIELPRSITIDATNSTSLEDEYLLTSAGTLHVVKRYPNAGKEKVFIRACHPTNPSCADLLLKKSTDLKKVLENIGAECADKTKNAELRKAIWLSQSDLALQEIDIDISKIDAKSIWDQLKAYMPLYSLFQSDRKNSDGDSEVQDPMRLAVKEIIEDPQIQRDLTSIAENVKRRLEVVASKTLEKLSEMNPAIAQSLDPKIPETGDLKWADVFKNVSITGDGDIPVNKRGSGVKRLILINFFRAEAERKKEQAGLRSIVYAIEEPETSQHPDHQRMLIEALVSLSRLESTQVLLTTHSPEIVKKLRFENIVLITGNEPENICNVKESELPYPSLNEVNYSAFGESTHEYHNELYGYIEAENELNNYKQGKPMRQYNQLQTDGASRLTSKTLTEYIRHQIHHPENDQNPKFTDIELQHSISEMRQYITASIRK